jgi:hypothetical protein
MPDNQGLLKINLSVILTGIVIAAGIVATYIFHWNGIQFSVQVSQLMTKISPLILAAAFIERAVEVLISPWRDTDAAKLQTAVNVAKANAVTVVAGAAPAAVAAAVGAPPTAGAPPVVVVTDPAAIQTVQAKADNLHDYRGATRLYAFLASLVLGFAVALAGLRTLAQMLDPSVDLTKLSQTLPRQIYFFYIVDVVLTATLLAGGAAGIHSVVDAFTSFFDASATKSSNSANLPTR